LVAFAVHEVQSQARREFFRLMMILISYAVSN
jgi:hypothetical protein